MVENEKTENSSSLTRLLGLVKPQYKLLTIGMIALLLSSLAVLILPFVFGLVVDTLTGPPGETRDELNRLTFILLGIFFLTGIFNFIRGWVFNLIGHRIVAKLRKDIFNAIVTQEINFFDNHKVGEITSRLTSDTQVVQTALTTNIAMLLQQLAQILGSIVILLILSWKLCLVMFAIVPLVAVGAVVYGRFMQRLFKEFQDQLAAATALADEIWSSIRTVRSFAKEAASSLAFSEEVTLAYYIGRKISVAYGLFNGLIGFLPQAAIALILWYGGVLVIEEELSTGLLTSFLLYTMNVAFAFAILSSLFGEFMGAVGASERIFGFLDRTPEINYKGGCTVGKLSGQIKYEKVCFTYPMRDKNQVLTNVTLDVQAGSIVALVGPSGSGKSTMVSLLERFYDVSSGSIKVDGQELKSLDAQTYRQHVALVQQEPVLFASTIRENICYGMHRPVEQEDVEAAAKKANAHSFIESFPEGYSTQVGERGVRLSGGQKQRIAIARALLMDPEILLLDEATSALDAESEHLVQEAIEHAFDGRTVIIIAHRLSTIQRANKIVVMKKGEIKELGSHNELLEIEDGIYRALVQRQTQWVETEMDS
eukprot:Lithocolla_globosa_v1_NODE_75_length_6869_cov_16.602289.p2 type:complete len:595 gc:universal NODE_75_length_6869_cov_16.602289:5081-6865(+)